MMLVAAKIALTCVVLAILSSLTEGRRAHRLGVTSLAVWCMFSLCMDLLKLSGDAMHVPIQSRYVWALGVLCGAWALWDVSRLTRLYGTTTLLAAADVARGFLARPSTSASMWAHWAEHLPKAAWLKGPRGMMLAINRHYEHQYGVPRSYVGGTDSQQWGDDIGQQFGANDREVFELGRPVVVRESAPTWSDPKRESLFLKFPVRDSRGTIVGVGGIELVYESEHDEHEDGGP